MKISEFNQTMAYLLRPEPRQMLQGGSNPFIDIEDLNKKLHQANLNRKTESIFNALKNYSKATTLVTGNVGCLYQIRAGIKIKNIDIRVLHPIVFLAERLIKNESQKIP